jgi:hypothetical protein
LLWAPLLAIAAAAFAIEIPFFFRGFPSGHDFEFHLYSWLEVFGQWKQGILYPRWAALAQFGYGEPRFVFYPPASWTLGAALSAIFPFTVVPGIYIFLTLLAAGISMFLLARRLLQPCDAIFAAVLYAVNPYHLVIVYWRSAFAELLASSLLPLLFLAVLKAETKGRRVTVFLAIVLAGSWLTNAPAAVMIHYSLALLIVVFAWVRRSPRVLLVGLSSVLLGATLASFYLLPAVYEQKWVNIAEAVSPGVRPADSFLFTHTTDPDHDRFDHLVSTIAVAEILLTLLAAWGSRKWGAQKLAARDLRIEQRELWYLLISWAAVCAVLMLSITGPLWTALPKLRFVQFPWRLLLCFGIPFTFLTTLGVRKWAARVAVYVGMLCVLAFVWQHFQPPWWDHAADLREMQDFMASGAGYEGTDEYTPTAIQPPLDLDKDARRVTVQGPAHALIRVSDWRAQHKVFTAEMLAADNLVLRLFNYPAWQVEVNGRVVQAGTRIGTGQMLVPVETGMNRVQITFVRTWDRKLGPWISLLGLLLVIALWRTPRSFAVDSAAPPANAALPSNKAS